MMTADEAYNKHIKMWKAMQEKLGDNPRYTDREQFKECWCREHGEDHIDNYCYLCQYDDERFGDWRAEHFGNCGDRCLVDWGEVYVSDRRYIGCCSGKTRYGEAPISEILQLPRRENINNDC